MIIDLETARARLSTRNAQKQVRYIITIGTDEMPDYTSCELKEGVITVMITARTEKEAEQLYKISTAVLQVAQL